MLPNNGESTDPWTVPNSGSTTASPSSTPTCKHLAMSPNSDPSATRTSSIFFNSVRSKLSKKDTMSASKIHRTSPWCTICSRVRTASWALRPGRNPYEQLKKILLVDGFEYLAHGVLDHFVLERRNPNRPRLALGLWDVHPSDRLVGLYSPP